MVRPTSAAAPTEPTKKNQLLARYGLGALPQPEKLTVEALLLQWLEDKSLEIKPTTYDCYHTAIHKHIIPKLGKMLVQKLETYHLEDFYKSMARAGLRRSTIRKSHVTLSSALHQTKRRKIISENPADDAELPQGREAFSPKIWTATEARAFLTHVADDRQFALYFLALMGSFRKGELLGLKWSAVTLEEHPDPDVGRYVAVRVLNNRTNSGSKVLDLTPKTHRSKRPVVLPPEAWEVLQAHRVKMQVERAELIAKGYTPEDGGYVFLSPLHLPWHPANFYNREWLPLLGRAGVTGIRFHDLRHTHITLDMAMGGDLKTASQRAGHASIQITADTYQHPNVEQHLRAASRIMRFLTTPEIKADAKAN